MTRRAPASFGARLKALREAAGFTQDELATIAGLGHVEYSAGNLEAARASFARSLDSFRALGVPSGIGNTLTELAGVALTEGEVTQAEKLLDEATAVLRDGAPWFRSLAVYVRAVVAVRRGRSEEAIAHVREGLACSRQLQDKYAYVYGLVPLAAAARLKRHEVWAATEREVRACLTPDLWSRAYAAGRRMSIDTLLHDLERH